MNWICQHCAAERGSHMESGDDEMSAIDSLAASLHHAILIGLDPIEHEEYEFRRTPGKAGAEKVPTGRMKQLRPRDDHCQITMFQQAWGSTALGFGGIGGQAITSAYTTVVIGPCADACVYFAGRLAYHIKRPNMQFYEDMAAQHMCEVSGAAKRYGRAEA